MGRGKHGSGARGKGLAGEGPFCPLCIEPLDEHEQAWRPCPCGYQLCTFCIERIKLECGNLCPGCRTEYGSAQDPFKKADKAKTSPRAVPAKQKHQSPAKPLASPIASPHILSPRQSTTSSSSPAVSGEDVDRRDSQGSNSQSTYVGAGGRQPPALPEVEQLPVEEGTGPAAKPALPQPNSPAPQQESSREEARQGQPTGASNVKFTLPAKPLRPHSTTSDSPSAEGELTGRGTPLQPTWAGMLPRPPATPDPEASALRQSLQQAVAAGVLSSQEGAAKLVAALKQRNGEAAARPMDPVQALIAALRPATAATAAASPVPIAPSRPHENGGASSFFRQADPVLSEAAAAGSFGSSGLWGLAKQTPMPGSLWPSVESEAVPSSLQQLWSSGAAATPPQKPPIARPQQVQPQKLGAAFFAQPAPSARPPTAMDVFAAASQQQQQQRSVAAAAADLYVSGYERAATKSSLYDSYLQQQRLPKPQLPVFAQAQANGSPAELGYLAGRLQAQQGFAGALRQPASAQQAAANGGPSPFERRLESLQLGANGAHNGLYR